MKRKSLLTVALSLGLAFAASITSFAGQWKSDEKGYWYEEEDGTYPVSSWKQINNKWYYFGDNGYLLANTTTPDGYRVGADGVWIEGVNAEFKVKDQVLWAFNVSSYDELAAGLVNMQKQWYSGGVGEESYTDYKITANNIPFTIKWRFSVETIPIQMGDMVAYQTTGVSTPEKFLGVEGTMESIFEGLNKKDYTIAEFGEYVKKNGASNVRYVDKIYTEYLPGFNGMAGANYTNRDAYVFFDFGDLSFNIFERNKLDDLLLHTNSTNISVTKKK